MKIIKEQLEGSKAFPSFLREYASLIEMGWARPFTVHRDKHKIIYAVGDNGEIQGGIVYGISSVSKTGWIVFSFTVPKYQKQGVYTALHEVFEDTLKSFGMTGFASHVNVKNLVRQVGCKKVGMEPEYYVMVKTFSEGTLDEKIDPPH